MGVARHPVGAESFGPAGVTSDSATWGRQYLGSWLALTLLCCACSPRQPGGGSAGSTNTPVPVSPVGPELKAEIDAWIAANHRNQFGDAPGTMYPGGSPLFDESTGIRLQRYEYIIRNHPGIFTNLPAPTNSPVTVSNRVVGPSTPVGDGTNSSPTQSPSQGGTRPAP